MGSAFLQQWADHVFTYIDIVYPEKEYGIESYRIKEVEGFRNDFLTIL